ncbi:MAG: hypothetical protein ACREQ2_01505 [Candidatus Binatia bacterium]
MRRLQKNSPQENSPGAKQRCNHPLAVVIDPTDRELGELEQMLAQCPNCSRWSPGDGPIMAVVSSHHDAGNEEPKELG